MGFRFRSCMRWCGLLKAGLVLGVLGGCGPPDAGTVAISPERSNKKTVMEKMKTGDFPAPAAKSKLNRGRR
jgi:hypothetical protein